MAIVFHGGGWGGGHRKQFRYICDYFASRGLVTATASYQLAPKNTRVMDLANGFVLPMQKAQSAGAKKTSAELGSDPERV